jgi:glycerate 2-kinase
LATATYPARLNCLILSDVVGDLLDVIASGPTVPDTTTYKDALKILERYNLLSSVPKSLINYLEKGKEGIYPETPKTENPLFNRTQNVVIGSNKIALDAANQKATSLGFNSFISTSELVGNVIETAHALIKTAITAQNDNSIKKPCCLLFGGETTIKINGTGTGGRNQHLALYTSLLLKDKNGITFLAAGTDGTDGPTVAAGAVVNTKTFEHALSIGLNINQYLENFDSFHFFEKAGGHIITGPTMTNVMDIIVIIIE